MITKIETALLLLIIFGAAFGLIYLFALVGEPSAVWLMQLIGMIKP